MKITLATHGSQGTVALRELFAFGCDPSEISVVLSGDCNGPIIEFLKFNEMPIKIIYSGKEFDGWLSCENEESLLISVSWKYKFSSYALNFFKGRTLNFHPGLLPEYRGCYSTPWSLINNEKYVGYTYHYLNEKYDEGNILLRRKTRIQRYDTAHSLNYKIFQKGLSKIGGAILKVGNDNGDKQLNRGHYYANELPFKGVIQPDWDDDKSERFIRAMYFPPFKSAVYIKEGVELYINDMPTLKKVKNG